MALFGTDGVRGVAGESIDAALALRLGHALGEVLGEKSCVVIGRDTRVSGSALECALASGLSESGVRVVLIGIAPTPCVAYVVRKYGFDAGAMISASHNAAQYNGIKLFGAQGFKLCNNMQSRIEELIEKNQFHAKKYGTVSHDFSLVDSYVKHLQGLPFGELRGVKICMDLGHGAACRTAACALGATNAEVILVASRGQGELINAGCGAMYPKGLAKMVEAMGCHLGFALDGDADRVIACNAHGELMDGDFLLLAMAQKLKREGRLKGAVAGTVMTNSGLELALNKMGHELVRTQVGDRYVIEKMLQDGLSLGGESSGHIIAFPWCITGDGVAAAMLTAHELIESEQQLRQLYTPYAQVHFSVPANSCKPLDSRFEQFKQSMTDSVRDLRLVVRPSGTEPIIRITAECIERSNAQQCANRVRQFLIGAD